MRPLHATVTYDRYIRPLHATVTYDRYMRPLHATVTGIEGDDEGGPNNQM